MSNPVSLPTRGDAPDTPRRERWPLVGIAAGITGALATVAFDIHVESDLPGGAAATMAVIDDVNQRNAHLSIIFGYTTVALLLVLTAIWRGVAERRLPESIAARVVSGGFTAAAGALSLGYGWTSVRVAAGAFVWMGLKERSNPLWLGIFSILPIIPSWGAMIATGLPGLPAISTIWMIVAFAGLALHKGAIRQQATEPAVTGGRTVVTQAA